MGASGSNEIDFLKSNKRYWTRLKNKLLTLDEKSKVSLPSFLGIKYRFFYKIKKYNPEEYNDFIEVFPNLAQLLIEGEENKYNNIKILEKNGKNLKCSLSRKQVAYIFTLGFLGIYTPDNNRYLNSFEFDSILSSSQDDNEYEFGLCFLNYLTNIGRFLKQNNTDILSQQISFFRNSIPEKLEIKENIPLCEIEIKENGSMYDSKATYIVDFANQYIGGATLNGGCVQEEILFAIEPELTCSMAFMEVMTENDAIRIDNSILYNNHKGYGKSFEYESDAIKNNNNIIKHRILAMDAICISGNKQFREKNIMRDLHKAFVCFNLVNFDENDNVEKSIATGNWGCGVFGGDHELKFIQQWIAASFAKVKKLEYYSFKNKEMDKVTTFFSILKERYKSANNLYKALMSNSKDFICGNVLGVLLSKDVIDEAIKNDMCVKI